MQNTFSSRQIQAFGSWTSLKQQLSATKALLLHANTWRDPTLLRHRVAADGWSYLPSIYTSAACAYGWESCKCLRADTALTIAVNRWPRSKAARAPEIGGRLRILTASDPRKAQDHGEWVLPSTRRAGLGSSAPPSPQGSPSSPPAPGQAAPLPALHPTRRYRGEPGQRASTLGRGMKLFSCLWLGSCEAEMVGGDARGWPEPWELCYAEPRPATATGWGWTPLATCTAATGVERHPRGWGSLGHGLSVTGDTWGQGHPTTWTPQERGSLGHGHPQEGAPQGTSNPGGTDTPGARTPLGHRLSTTGATREQRHPTNWASSGKGSLGHGHPWGQGYPRDRGTLGKGLRRDQSSLWLGH